MVARRGLAALLTIALGSPSIAFGDLLAGSEFQINTYTTGSQAGHRARSVSISVNDGFVVVWDSPDQDGHYRGVFGRQFDTSGVAAGPEFQVNTYTTTDQQVPAVSFDAAANFIVVWESTGQDGSDDGIFVQRFTPAAFPVGTEFQANSYTTSAQDYAVVGIDAVGNFVVVWESFGQDGDANGIFGQRFDSAAVAVGTEFAVNTATTARQDDASVAVDVAGNFVVVWSDDGGFDGDGYGIAARLYDSSGAPVGDQFQVNSYTTGRQVGAVVGGDGDGDFVVVWESSGQDGSSDGVFGQRLDVTGSFVGTEFQVNTYTSFAQDDAAVAIDGDGSFLVVWESLNQDGSIDGVFGQEFSADGLPLGTEFQVNAYTTAAQDDVAVATDRAGNFVVAWESTGQDGNADGIFGRVLCKDADDDGVCDSDDACPGFDGATDADGDGVADACDQCPGFDDTADADGDGVADGCDECAGFDDTTDSDGDGVADGCDVCAGFDDAVDADGDGVADGCDECAGFDDAVDADGDGVADGCDECAGFDDAVDADGDGVADGCDECAGLDDAADADGDGVADGCDECAGFDDTADVDGDGIADGCDDCSGDDEADTDADGVADGCDECPGFDDAADADGDGVADGCDECAGFDDAADADGDGVADGCDECAGFDDAADADGDGVADGCDECPGFDDAADADGDGVADGCDECPGFDDAADADGDGVADGCDECPGFDDAADADGDGVADGCDECPGFDDAADADSDGVADGCDECAGFDDAADGDGDGVADGCDACPGFDDAADADGDGVADGCDECAGFDDAADGDGDGFADGCDECLGFDDAADADGDGVADGCDECPGSDDGADTDGDGVADGCDECPGFDDAADADADGVADGCDACTVHSPGQTIGAKGLLALKRINTDAVPGNDKLGLRGEFTLPAPGGFATLAPSDDGARLVIEGVQGAVRVDAQLPAGARWSVNGAGDRWSYIDKAGTVAGIVKMIITELGGERVGVSIKGKNGTYPVVTADAPPTVIVVLGAGPSALAGECGETGFAPQDCSFNGSQNVLICR